MKNLIFNCFTILILIFSISSFSQETNSELMLNQKTSITSFDIRSKKLVGSSYIDDNFLPAKLSNSEEIYSIRYNAHQDEMEIEKDGKPFHLPKSFNYTVEFLGINKVYQVFSYENKISTTPGFFVVLNRGENISLLLKEKIKFYEEEKATSGYDKYKPPTLKRIKDKLYIGYKNNTTIELPNNKKDILALFLSKTKEISSYAKNKKLNFKKKEDLIKIFVYYSTL